MEVFVFLLFDHCFLGKQLNLNTQLETKAQHDNRLNTHLHTSEQAELLSTSSN